MANDQGMGDGGPANAPFLTSLAARRPQVAYGFLGLAALLAAIPITLSILYGWSTWELILWGSLLAVVALGAGLIALLLPTPKSVSEPDLLRFLFLSVGGLMGLLTAYLGLLLTLWRYRDVFTGPLKEWAKHSQTVWACAAALFGGMVLVFLSLLLARGVERSSILMRRLVYGFNAIFTTFLLLAILILANIIVYAPMAPFTLFQKQQDWTAGSIYTLSPGAQTQLAALKKPVKVLVMLARQRRLRSEVATLLDNCHNVNKEFTWEEIPVSMANKSMILSVQKEYQLGEDGFGLVVLYGEEPNQDHAFVKEEDLADQGGMDESKVSFKGEAALMKAIEFLSDEKKRPVIYFTQGEGELDFNDRDVGKETGMGALTEQLGKGNYDLRELRFGPDVKTIPEDAEVVVVARPTRKWPDAALKALGDYLHGVGTKDGKKGKAVLLFDVVTQGGDMARTGLEDFVGEFNVKVGANRLVTLDRTKPVAVTVMGNPFSRNPVAGKIVIGNSVVPFNFNDARTVEPLPGGGNPNYTAEVLLQTLTEPLVKQTDLKASPASVAANAEALYSQNRDVPGLSENPLPVAVAVSESKGLPPGPEHQFLRPETQPRLVVFGDASWIANEGMGGNDEAINADLFANVLYWLREKPAIGQTAAGVTRGKYELHVTPAVASAIEWLPLLLMPLGILILGLGVWVVRRR